MENIGKTVLDDYNNTITIHSTNDFVSMRNAGELASKVLDFIEPEKFSVCSINEDALDNLLGVPASNQVKPLPRRKLLSFFSLINPLRK